ncbi:MAG: hypothetical protein QOK04_546 [Solirubrobacteraceae bacterium]|jgi:hypothetical protein|nr:hypothetical protein [Solirubrobacteraceae bacterium]
MRANRVGKVAVVAGTCAALGAGAAVAGNAASAPSGGATAGNKAAGPNGAKGRNGRLRALRRAVHVDAVVPTKDGKFANVTLDRGIVQSVQGDQLTLKEGTRKATYKTVTLTIPGNAVVRDNKRPAKLSDVKSGQRAVVFRGPKRTAVVAHDVRKK